MTYLGKLPANTILGQASGSSATPGSLPVTQSLIIDTTGLRLSGDSTSPSAPGDYGVGDTGTKGWYANTMWDSMRTMPSYGTRRVFIAATDFSGLAGALWSNDVSNGANTFTVSDVAGRLGYSRSSTAASAVDCAGWRITTGDLLLGAGRVSFRGDCRINQLSDGVDSFNFRAGIGEMYINTLPVDGAYIRYAHGTNSGKWQCVNVSNSVESTADSGVTMTAGTFYTLEVEVDAAATQARYWINGTLVSTISGGLPTATLTRGSDAGVRICKTLGTTACTVDTDYLALRWDLTTPL